MNILLLQGPLGPFFRTLGNHLVAEGHNVFHISFNGGDECWRSQGSLYRFTSTMKEWPAYFRHFCQQHQIDSVMCYGDCRPYHAKASNICRQLDIAFWALEEGYLRPDFVTMELGGVNANSSLYRVRHTLPHYQPGQPFPVRHKAGKTFGSRAWFAIRYHVNKRLGTGLYPHFVSHRPWGLLKEALSWVKGGLLKLRFKSIDRAMLQELQAEKGRVFLLPLQVSEDFQILSHSNYRDVATVIKEVVGSFARHADSADTLLIKHHPMDRGYINYQPLINQLREQHQLGKRLRFGYELPLPEVYPLLKGVVTVNSTVGLSALLHHLPVKCLGKALYDIPGLTTPGPLSSFWRKQQPVCEATFDAVRNALLHQTQINGSFFTLMEETAVEVAQVMVQHHSQQRELRAAS